MPDDRSTSSSQPTDAVKQLSTFAAGLASLAAELGHMDVATAIRDDAKRRLDDGRVRVVVLGEIKHGKSTLINALLGEPLLPAGVTPTTGAIVAIRVDTIRHRLGTFLVNAGGERSEVERERFEQLARGKDQDEAGRTPELLVDPLRLPATLELIDTPGFNDIDRFRAAVSRSELPRADVLVLVLDATRVLSRSELTLIRDAIAAVGGLGDSGARCLLVINRIDLVPEDERPQVVEHLRSNLTTVIPGVIPGELEPFLCDSRTALREPDNEAAPVQAVKRLREQLWGLAGRGREILPARARAALLRQAKLLGYNATVQARALQLAHTQIAEEIAAVEQAMANIAGDLHAARKQIAEVDTTIIAASNERTDKFRAELEQAALAQIQDADIHTLTQVIPGAIQDAFLQFVAHESERLRGELEQLTRELFATYGELAKRRLSDATLPLGFHTPGLYVEPPKMLVEVAMITLGLIGTLIWYLGNTVTGMVMTIASPLATVILREKTVRDARAQARAVLPGALDRAIAAMREVVHDVVVRHGEALDEHLTLADRTLSEQLLEALRRAEQRLAAHEAELARLGAAAPSEGSATEGASANAGASADVGSGSTPAGPPAEPATGPGESAEALAKRLRERVSAAAQAEFGALEQRLEVLTAQLDALTLDDRAEPETDAPILH